MKNASAEKLADFCEEKTRVKSAYMWGEYGRPITAETVDSLSRRFPERYTSKRQKKLKALENKGYIGCDCGGLYKYFLWTRGGTEDFEYDRETDFTGFEMYSHADKRGGIENLPEQRGLLLYMHGHIGIYIGGGYAVECTLGAYGDGIVKTPVKGRGWTHWLRMPELNYSDKTNTKYKLTLFPLAFRSEPSTVSGKRYFYIPKGTPVKTLKENAASSDGYMWDTVLCDNLIGYCANAFLKPIEIAESKTTTDMLALRTEPSTQTGDRLFYIPKGETVTVLCENQIHSDGYRWDKIEYNGTIGYSANKWLK